MYTIDDPMLALILRFVGHSQEIDLRNHEFIQEELKTIREYIESFPPEEQDARAIEWVEKYAREYRESRVQEIVGEMFSSLRCPDCPLTEADSPGYCRIHEQWLGLLQRYRADEINSRAYVESSLELLAQHKEDLKMKLAYPGPSRRPLPA